MFSHLSILCDIACQGATLGPMHSNSLGRRETSMEHHWSFGGVNDTQKLQHNYPPPIMTVSLSESFSPTHARFLNWTLLAMISLICASAQITKTILHCASAQKRDIVGVRLGLTPAGRIWDKQAIAQPSVTRGRHGPNRGWDWECHDVSQLGADLNRTLCDSLCEHL